MAKPMTKTEWLNWIEKAWDEAQQAAWAEKPKMRRTTRDEKIVNPGVYEVPEFECPRCGHCCQQKEWVGLDDDIPGLGLVTEEFYNGMLCAEDILRKRNT